MQQSDLVFLGNLSTFLPQQQDELVKHLRINSFENQDVVRYSICNRFMDFIQLKFIIGFKFKHTVQSVASVLSHIASKVFKVASDALNYVVSKMEAISLQKIEPTDHLQPVAEI